MHKILILLTGLAVLVGQHRPAYTQPIRAIYEVYAAGMTVLQLDAEIEFSATGYHFTTIARTRGLAAAFVPGEQATRVIGSWAGAVASPASYAADGLWRGRTRRTVLQWRDGDPVIGDLQPANDEEREAVPIDLQRGTIDALSALAQLSRSIAQTGACDAQAMVFDGRRRSDYVSRTAGRELIRPWRDAWHGEALRCAFEGRLVAGFRRDRSRDEAAPQLGTAWLAPPFAGAAPVPVRVEIPSRWFGTATAILLRAAFSGPVEARQ
jgi:hypothetical protein